MKYNIARYLKTLELDKILELLANETTLADATQLSKEIRPALEIEAVKKLLSETEAAYNFMSGYTAPSFGAAVNVSALKRQLKILKGMGVEEIPAVGEKFDPNVHAAVSHIEDDNFGENEISVVMLKGYKFKDKVLRHSMVQVAN